VLLKQFEKTDSSTFYLTKDMLEIAPISMPFVSEIEVVFVKGSLKLG